MVNCVQDIKKEITSKGRTINDFARYLVVSGLINYRFTYIANVLNSDSKRATTKMFKTKEFIVGAKDSFLSLSKKELRFVLSELNPNKELDKLWVDSGLVK